MNTPEFFYWETTTSLYFCENVFLVITPLYFLSRVLSCCPSNSTSSPLPVMSPQLHLLFLTRKYGEEQNLGRVAIDQPLVLADLKMQLIVSR